MASSRRDCLRRPSRSRGSALRTLRGRCLLRRPFAGWYADLLRPSRSSSKAPRIVVTTRTGDWQLYFEALEKGAFDVNQSPCYSTHVEMTITRVLREEEARLEYRSSR